MEIHQQMVGIKRLYKHDLWAHGMTERFWLHIAETETSAETGDVLEESDSCIVIDMQDCIKLRDELSAFINNRNIANETS